ncbi:MAG: hypothetical protein ACLFTK_04545 [Anaerolineales bacterium]
MKPCQVEVTFTQNGTPRPRSLTLDGQTLTVIDIGRRWADESGQHMLVRVADGRVYELLYRGAIWQAALRAGKPRHI